MINPLRSEAEAFRFLIASIVYFAAIVIASLAGGKWVGLAVFVALTAAAVTWWWRERQDERPETTEPRPHAAGELRILVVANETVGGHALRSTILAKSLDVR
jgi:membrane protein implicated in regulation of membrane protease activity